MCGTPVSNRSDKGLREMRNWPLCRHASKAEAVDKLSYEFAAGV
ncbi:hypothetical protein RD1_0105 [Roseobacter denitrificans OCh 114]|uniref:Uncharacterized protein n=1 Tax=Roseobacter denitrificans (strain ATCC 33942 / OCh 114) TaxID=375451 RepID=Q16DV3_ROSDO|nr:hypothetical protein RD1_0105 [Roseobacter denitrificans OCh 114]